jgi:hypothetical protein
LSEEEQGVSFKAGDKMNSYLRGMEDYQNQIKGLAQDAFTQNEPLRPCSVNRGDNSSALSQANLMLADGIDSSVVEV